MVVLAEALTTTIDQTIHAGAAARVYARAKAREEEEGRGEDAVAMVVVAEALKAAADQVKHCGAAAPPVTVPGKKRGGGTGEAHLRWWLLPLSVWLCTVVVVGGGGRSGGCFSSIGKPAGTINLTRLKIFAPRQHTQQPLLAPVRQRASCQRRTFPNPPYPPHPAPAPAAQTASCPRWSQKRR
eukprot:194960-Chlamydomonas_euryale.AAC.9